MRLSENMRKTCLAAALSVVLSIPLSAHAMANKGAYAPPINVWTLSGQNVTLSTYKGKVLVLDFFATWCAPCRLSIPHLIDLNSRYGKQGLQMLGMSFDEGGEKNVRNFVADKKINYPVAMADAELFDDYLGGRGSLPTLFVINKKGILVEKYLGFNDQIAKSLEALIKKLLAE